jgi:hypothetical protein
VLWSRAYHRVRSRLVSRRTATVNQIRAFLIEEGIAVPPGLRALRASLLEVLKNRADEISPRMADPIVGLYEDWLWLAERIETIAAERPVCRRPMSVPGLQQGRVPGTEGSRRRFLECAIGVATFCRLPGVRVGTRAHMQISTHWRSTIWMRISASSRTNAAAVGNKAARVRLHLHS